MFDQDPYEQANISAADFAMMCDEMKNLKEQRDELLDAASGVMNITPYTKMDDVFLAQNKLRSAINKVKGGE